MDDWKAAAICVAAFQWAEHMESKLDELPNEGKVIVSLIKDFLSVDDYNAALDTINSVTEKLLFEDWPEAARLREYLGLRTVN